MMRSSPKQNIIYMFVAMSKSHYVPTRIPTVQNVVQKERNCIGSNNIQYLGSPSSRVYTQTKLIYNQQNIERSRVELKKEKIDRKKKEGTKRRRDDVQIMTKQIIRIKPTTHKHRTIATDEPP